MAKVAFLVALVVALAYADHPLCSTSPLPNKDGWCDCSGSSDDIEVVNVVIVPAGGVLNKGQNISVTAQSYDSKTYDITGGTLSVDVKYGFVPILNHNYDLCSEMAHTPYPCPLKPYTVRTLSNTQMIPSNAPSGVYKGKVSATDQQSNEIICIQFSMKVQ